MASIKPIVFPFKGTANFLLVTSASYALGIDTTTGVNWGLYEEKEETVIKVDQTGQTVKDENGVEETETRKEYLPMDVSGTIKLTEAEFKNWGKDDNYIIKLVAERIPVELV